MDGIAKILKAQTVLAASFLLYTSALFLPAYNFDNQASGHHYHPTGLQIVMDSPSSILGSLAYFATVFFIIKMPHEPYLPKVTIIIALVLAAVSSFGYILGDPMPGSVVSFGIAPALWMASLTLIGFARLRKQNPQSLLG